MLLFAHAPLLFSHGLRGNTMGSALALAYCGGVYHYLRWISPFGVRMAADQRSNARTTNGQVHDAIHTAAVALYFVLGFMTKQTIVGVHVYERFTSALDPGHRQPWDYYLGQMIDFWETGALILIGAGLGLLGGWTARRAPSAIVLVFWLLPLVAISAVTSKLYHHAFPFLPPLALMGGYAAAIVPAVGWAAFDRALDRVYAALGEDMAVTLPPPYAACGSLSESR